MERIDNLDKKILKIIMNNARIASKDVAQECGVSRAAVHQRIQRMNELNVITGSSYNVDPAALGFTTCTYVGIKLERSSLYREIIPKLKEIPEIVECHYTTGSYSVLVKLYARDNHHLMELIYDKIQHIPGVITTETLISLDQCIGRKLPVNFMVGWHQEQSQNSN